MDKNFSDIELVEGMLMNNEAVIKYFFFEKCTPIFRNIKYKINCQEEMNDFINEFYLYLQAENWRKLRQFDYRIAFMSWISIVAFRFFRKQQAKIMDYQSIDSLLYEASTEYDEEQMYNSLETENFINSLPDMKSRLVVRKLILEEIEPLKLADKMKISVANLYNIKHRVLKKLTALVGKEKRIQ